MPKIAVAVPCQEVFAASSSVTVEPQAEKNQDSWLRERIRSLKKGSGKFIYYPATLLLGVYLTLAGEQMYQKHLTAEKKIERRAEQPRYERLISSDFRYRRTAKLLEAGRITPEQAAIQARAIEKIYKDYFSFRTEHPIDLETDPPLELLDHYFFAHLRPLLEESGASSTKIRQLFVETDLLHYKYELLASLILKKPLSGDVLQAPFVPALLRQLQESPFYQELAALHEQGKITDAQFLRAAQAEVYRQYTPGNFSRSGAKNLER